MEGSGLITLRDIGLCVDVRRSVTKVRIIMVCYEENLYAFNQTQGAIKNGKESICDDSVNDSDTLYVVDTFKDG